MTNAIVVKLKRLAHFEMSAYDINFDATYQFEITEGDTLYLWSGVKAERVGDVAVVDWRDGRNGLMTEMSKTSRGVTTRIAASAR